MDLLVAATLVLFNDNEPDFVSTALARRGSQFTAADTVGEPLAVLLLLWARKVCAIFICLGSARARGN